MEQSSFGLFLSEKVDIELFSSFDKHSGLSQHKNKRIRIHFFLFVRKQNFYEHHKSVLLRAQNKRTQKCRETCWTPLTLGRFGKHKT